MAVDLSVVVPVHNEERVLPTLFKELMAVLDPLSLSWEAVFVDDGSADGSWGVISSLHEKHPDLVRGVRFTRNFGKEAAICAGLRVSQGQAVVVMDADLQHPPHLIPTMLEAWQEQGVLIVEAVKEKRQEEDVPRRLGARLFYSLFKKASGIDIERATDFKLLDRKVVELYLQLQERERFFRGLTAWTGFPSQKIPFVPPVRAEGTESRWSLKKLTNFALGSIISFSSAPLRLVTYLGILTFMGSFLLGVQTLVVKLRGKALPGFATVILVELILGSVLMVALGLIGEYLARIYEETKGRPLYLVSEALGEEREKTSSSNCGFVN
jgi:glycosyltransferase involved in cell wall biosynthesis